MSPPLDNVIKVLERDGKTTAFASFWISGRLTFESSERITAVATDIGPTAKELEDKVRTSKDPAYIFFAKNEYRPGTPDGDALVKHEAAHAEQQKFAPVSGPLTVSMPGDAMEREAEAFARDVPA